MKRCEMGKTYIKLNDERESYEEIQKFFEEWGLEKVSEESLGDELFHRVITYKGNGIEFKLIWYKTFLLSAFVEIRTGTETLWRLLLIQSSVLGCLIATTILLTLPSEVVEL